MITMIDVGITVPGKNEYNLWPSPVPFHKAFLSVTNIVFAYGELEFDSCAILADLLINSWARRFLQLHQRVQKSQRLSQSTFSTADLGHFHVHRCRSRRLSLCGQQSLIARSWLCRQSRIQSRLWHCHSNGLPLQLI
jgi:hypothetical protein